MIAVKGALLEQLDMGTMRQVFDAVAYGYAEACALRAVVNGTPASADGRGRTIRLAMSALSPQVLFLPCLTEMQ